MKLKPLLATIAALVAIPTITSNGVGAYGLLGYSWASPTVQYYINPTNMEGPSPSIRSRKRF